MNRAGFVIFCCVVGSFGCARVEPVENTGEVAYAVGAPGAPLAHISIPRTHLGEQRQGEVTLFTNSGSPRRVFQGGSAPFAAALGDLTNDGLDEAVVASGGSLHVVGPSDCSITSFFGPTSPGFLQDDELAVGDVNNDGFEEIVVAHAGGGVSIHARPGTDLGTFPIGGLAFVAGDALAVGDLNDDGFADIVVGHRAQTFDTTDTGSISYHTHPSATLSPAGLPNSFKIGDRLAVGDLNGDGFAEVVIGRGPQLQGDTGFVEVGTLGASPTFNGPNSFPRGSDLAVGDLDGDGSAEVALGLLPSIDPGQGTILIISGSGTTGPELQLGNREFFRDDRLSIGHRAANGELDSDDDGILDAWETNAFDCDGDGVADLDLPSLGANPNSKDIFIEMDGFACAVVGGDCPVGDAHTDLPTNATMAPVVAAFAAAPVSNPVGPNGIALRVIIDESLAHREVCSFDEQCYDAIRAANFGTAAERAKPNATAILAAKRQVFRYALWAHIQPGGWTGMGETPGNDVMLTVGFALPAPGVPLGLRVAGPATQATDLMHELGHNLGLDHGGTDTVNYKPNYFSVMNYSFSGTGISPGNTLDYSRTALVDLDERGLDENVGIGGPAMFSAPYSCVNFTTASAPGSGNVDWNCTGPNTDVPVDSDINFDRTCITSGTNLVLGTTPGGDDIVQGGSIVAGLDARLDTLVVATGLGAGDVVVGNQILAGATRVLSTLPAGDDVVVSRLQAPPGGAVPGPLAVDDVAISEIRPGPDGVLNTTVLGNDDLSDGTRVTAGPDNVLDTMPDPADIVVMVDVAPGPNSVLDTVASPTDLLFPFLITAGLDGVLDSNMVCAGLQNDDLVVMGAISPGPDGTLDTAPCRDDQRVGEVVNDGPNRICESIVVPDDKQVRAPGHLQERYLRGAEDWSRLIYNFRTLGSYQENQHGVLPDELPMQELLAATERARSADLELTVVAPASVEAGSTFPIDVTIHNNGPQGAVGPTLNAPLPTEAPFVDCSSASGACGGIGQYRTVQVAELASGADSEARIQAAAECGSPTGQTLHATFQVASVSSDPLASNNVVDLEIVVNPTAPEITAPPDLALRSCDADGRATSPGTATVEDLCDPNPTVTIRVIELNGMQVDQPWTPGTPFGLGVTVLEYTATNAGGLSDSDTQRIEILPALASTVSFDLADGAQIEGSIFNAGSAGISMNNSAVVSQDLFSSGPMRLGPVALVGGSARSANSIVVMPGTTVFGGVFPFSTIPSLGLPAATGTFGGGSSITVHHQTLELVPGDHGDVRVLPGGTLILAAGEQRLSSLTVQPGSSLLCAGKVRLLVAGDVSIAGFVGTANRTALPFGDLYLGMPNARSLDVDTTLVGEIVAAQASVTLGGTLRGQLVGGAVQMKNAAALTCVAP